MPPRPTPPAEALPILDFWFVETPPEKHFKRDRVFDLEVKGRFGEVHGRAARGVLSHWQDNREGALALIILLDQFTRNIYRDSSRAFAQDSAALLVANHAISQGFDAAVPDYKRAFFYMPFMHSEAIADQDRCVELFKTHMPESNNVGHAETHREIIQRFGRFPHRNKVLGRDSTPEEMDFLANGGFSA